jgi:hypothetical protein
MYNHSLTIIFLIAILAFSPAALVAQEADFTHSAPLAPGMAIKIDCRAAKVRLIGTDGQSVDIVAKGHPAPVVAAGESVLTVTVPESGLKRLGPEVSVSIPRNAAATVELGVGDLEVEGLGGLLEARVGVGNILMSRVSAQASVRTGTGNVRASWRAGDVLPEQCRLSTGIGDVEVGLPREAEVRITAETGLGSIRGLGPGASGTSRSKSAGAGDRSLALAAGIGDIRISRGEDGDHYGDHWKERRRERARAHFGGGGGFFVSWPDRSYRDFNAATVPHGYPAVGKESHAWGGEGYAQFNRFRIGGMGWGQKIEARSSLDDTLRYATYNYGYGGLTLEYVVLRSSRADLSFGAMLGAGGADIRLARAVKSDIAWDEAAGLDDYREVSVVASGLAGMPMARLKIRLLSRLSIQGHAGYLYCRSSDWKYREDRDLFNVPRLDASGWVFAAGPHFGF